jgi:hypothetical protein
MVQRNKKNLLSRAKKFLKRNKHQRSHKSTKLRKSMMVV